MHGRVSRAIVYSMTVILVALAYAGVMLTAKVVLLEYWRLSTFDAWWWSIQGLTLGIFVCLAKVAGKRALRRYCDGKN